MPTATLTLTQFLLARIAEDEADPWRGAEIYGSDRCVGAAERAALAREEAAWVSRVMAECAAKRAIVNGMESGEIDDMFAPEILGLLAAVHSDHPDYSDEWRV